MKKSTENLRSGIKYFAIDGFGSRLEMGVAASSQS